MLCCYAGYEAGSYRLWAETRYGGGYTPAGINDRGWGCIYYPSKILSKFQNKYFSHTYPVPALCFPPIRRVKTGLKDESIEYRGIEALWMAIKALILLHFALVT
jgi:hypothetical protein